MVYLIKLEKISVPYFLIFIIVGNRSKEARIRIIRIQASFLPVLVDLITIGLAL